MAFPETRPEDHADEGWDETSNDWSSDVEFTDAGGGRLKTMLIAIAGEKIYFESY